MNAYQASERFVRWLERTLVTAARGDHVERLDVEPAGRFWLGCLSPEESVVERGLGDRGERLDPCATGVRVSLGSPPPWAFSVRVSARAWLRAGTRDWAKTEAINVEVPIDVATSEAADLGFGRAALSAALTHACGAPGLEAEVRVEVQPETFGTELAITLVNVSPRKHDELKDTNLYEVRLELSGLSTMPFTLEGLPDSFRYDRSVACYGINGGAVAVADGIRTTDTQAHTQRRPSWWPAGVPEPDLSFGSLAKDPMPSAQAVLQALRAWGEEHWSAAALDKRASEERWSSDMRRKAGLEAVRFAEEVDRIAEGVELLRATQSLSRAFKMMNSAMERAAAGKYVGWRPFQFGFLLANLQAIQPGTGENGIVDVIWFPTGGGKTETYLGLLLCAAFHDRLEGKRAGITAWNRFPLRMLSLQQTQRFANALAGAELVRREEGIEGEPFSVGFFVGSSSTPNRLPLEPREGQPNPNDPDMPGKYQVLLECPFCRASSIAMAFNRRAWTLEHRCTNDSCPWPDRALPFYIVDDEIFRFLPTIIVGTLDKAASVSLQAAMRGFVGPPPGRCSITGHGYTYSPRSKNPNGCLVPGCRGRVGDLDQPAHLFAPTFRLQDELHLLRDSLGAVDAHYESLLDHLEADLGPRPPKILASSATLAGYERQVEVLYGREARVFPLPGPKSGVGFWSSDSEALSRRYVALAPRGVTIEFAIDRALTTLQDAIRRLRTEPEAVCREAGIDPAHASHLLDVYGVDVVYGNSLRDIDAVERSLETQVQVDGRLNTASLTGRTDFDTVRDTLERLENPEAEFDERVHVVTASSMMSHGVDVDRLNCMAMIGVPLTTAEFIQATARVGRRWPGLVLVMHKMARERDAGVFKFFPQFVAHADRFVEDVPITRRSQRVLERTLPGLAMARLLALHEAELGSPLTTVSKLREYAESGRFNPTEEAAAVVQALGFDADLDERARELVERWYERYFDRLRNPGPDQRWPSDLCPGGFRPMMSLRDVEQVAPIYGKVE